MIKKYGWKYTMATIGAFFLGFFWPFGFFVCYMFNDVKDPGKKSLIKKLNIVSMIWFIMNVIAILGQLISNLFEMYA